MKYYIVRLDSLPYYRETSKEYADIISGKKERYSYHAGGRGNGAFANMYTEKQINRILGRYPEGVAEAIEVKIVGSE